MTNDLHHRLDERAALKAEFLRGASVLMLAPRRIGKTWLMDKVKNDMTDDAWSCITIDLEGKDSEEQFLRDLCQKIEETRDLKDRARAHVGQRFKRVLSGDGDGNLADALGKVNHRDFLEALVSSLDGEDAPTLILIDELALFFQSLADKDPDKARSLLYHLRGLMQACRNVRWFLTGSIGLDAVARRHGFEGALLGFEPFTLDPFTAMEAESFVAELFERRPHMKRFCFGPGAFDHLVSEIGWLSPYYLEKVVRLIKPEGDPPVASIAGVEAALADILKPDKRLHFSSWAEHVAKNFDAADAKRMHQILDILCESTDGEGEAALMTRLSNATGQTPTRRDLKDALVALEADAYLTCGGERWKFRSGLLRRYWLEYCQK